MRGRTRLALLSLFVVVAGQAAPVSADIYQEQHLVSNVSGLAPNTDPNLQNPWGVSFSPTSPFWVSNQITGNATLYNAAGVPQSLVVTIPPAGGGGNPTGQVFNSTASDFQIGGSKAIFMFSTLNGTITGWTGGAGNTNAVVAQSVPNASYTGLTLGNNGTANFLYAANDGAGKIDVFDKTFALDSSFNGKFTDPTLPSGFTPYNIRNIAGTVYVTYESNNGGGVVDAFDLNGNFLRRIFANDASGPLSHPWGVAVAPATFGQFANTLLVGNEGDGMINAFDQFSGNWLGHLQMVDSKGNPFSIGFGLWTLTFGNAGNNGNPNTLFFTAGINNETGGLFGSITAPSVPEPASAMLLLVGGGLMFAGWRARLWRRRTAE